MTTERLPDNLPWSRIPQRWGHSWHQMCSYLGTFPAALARSFITMLTDPGDVVLDPFSGRGTTLLECRLTGRVPLASDLNPVACALSRAKNTTASAGSVIERIAYLERRYDALLYVPEAQVQPDNIRLIYHPRALAQLCYLRRQLSGTKSEIDAFIIGAVLGIMHGSERQDGTSSYASISMPNTFSMSPGYVRRYVQTNGLKRVDRNVFELLRTKVLRLYRDGNAFRTSGVVADADAKCIDSVEAFAPYRGKVKLILTSPPYLDVVNYAKQNWIRTWFLGVEPDSVSGDLDDNLTLNDWLRFTDKVVASMKEMLAPGGVAVWVIGDVARSSRTTIPLAREFIRRITHNESFSYIGCLNDHIQTELKTTRIWKETKGKATAIDRVVVLSDEEPVFDMQDVALSLGDDPFELAPLNAGDLECYARSFAG